MGHYRSKENVCRISNLPEVKFDGGIVGSSNVQLSYEREPPLEASIGADLGGQLRVELTS